MMEGVIGVRAEPLTAEEIDQLEEFFEGMIKQRNLDRLPDAVIHISVERARRVIGELRRLLVIVESQTRQIEGLQNDAAAIERELDATKSLVTRYARVFREIGGHATAITNLVEEA